MKKTIKLLLILSLFLYGYESLKDFKKEDLFDIKKIDVEVENKKLLEDLLISLEDLKNHNIWSLNKKELEKEILKDVRIEAVRIKRQMPNKLVIAIKEKTSYVYVKYNNNIYISDKSGEIYGYMNESEKKNMPLLQIKSKSDLKELLEIMEKVNFKGGISQMYKIPNGVVIRTNSGFEIRTNKSIKKEKYVIVKKLYDQLEAEIKVEKNIDYIDIRFKDYVIKSL
ncbi:MAG: FtsQ-type POTRA domain-containing protein [Psychrilyobacter sp.]|nr:FtsQ-type POTRA domain-containing protein [Psychrilyobacter sp.]